MQVFPKKFPPVFPEGTSLHIVYALDDLQIGYIHGKLQFFTTRQVLIP